MKSLLGKGKENKIKIESSLNTKKYVKVKKGDINDLLAGKDVNVNSILEADALLEKALPDTLKAPGASPEGGIPDWSKFKGKNNKGMYHKNYNIDNETGRIYGHGPENKHAKMKHINIKLPNGNNGRSESNDGYFKKGCLFGT